MCRAIREIVFLCQDLRGSRSWQWDSSHNKYPGPISNRWTMTKFLLSARSIMSTDTLLEDVKRRLRSNKIRHEHRHFVRRCKKRLRSNKIRWKNRINGNTTKGEEDHPKDKQSTTTKWSNREQRQGPNLSNPSKIILRRGYQGAKKANNNSYEALNLVEDEEEISPSNVSCGRTPKPLMVFSRMAFTWTSVIHSSLDEGEFHSSLDYGSYSIHMDRQDPHFFGWRLVPLFLGLCLIWIIFFFQI